MPNEREPSPRLLAFALAVNRGATANDAAREAGYSPTYALRQSGLLLEQARKRGLIATVEDARAPLEAMREAVSAEDWTAIAMRAVQDARAGDAQARQWLRDTLLGRPVTRVDATVDQRTAIVFEYRDGVADDEQGEDDGT